jgi:hypothetical protein
MLPLDKAREKQEPRRIIAARRPEAKVEALAALQRHVSAAEKNPAAGASGKSPRPAGVHTLSAPIDTPKHTLMACSGQGTGGKETDGQRAR